MFKRKYIVPYVLCGVIVLIGIAMTITDSVSGGYLSSRLSGTHAVAMTGPSAIGVSLIAFVLIVIIGRDEKKSEQKEDESIPSESSPPSGLYLQLDKTTANIPFLKTQRLEMRLLVLVPVLVVLIGTTVYFATMPSVLERLTTESWCVDYITSKGKNYNPNTQMRIQIKITGPTFCDEQVDFRNNGRIVLPGFNTAYIYGQWSLRNDDLKIFNLDTLQHVLEGHYKIDMSSNRMELHSATTTIYCSQPEELRIPFVQSQ